MLWISSPVFYHAAIVPPSVQPFLGINPLSPIIESLRQIVLSGNLPDLMMVANALLSGTIFAVLGWSYFHHSRSQFMDLL
jgi:ABC-type polysaccharide/polyol phosphate export permease